MITMTERQRQIVSRYKESNMFDLWDAYASCSSRKRDAWNYCRRVYHDRAGDTTTNTNGNDRSPLKIIGANTFKFSAGFTYTTPQLETFMVYITDAGVTEFKITEEI